MVVRNNPYNRWGTEDRQILRCRLCEQPASTPARTFHPDNDCGGRFTWADFAEWQKGPTAAIAMEAYNAAHRRELSGWCPEMVANVGISALITATDGSLMIRVCRGCYVPDVHARHQHVRGCPTCRRSFALMQCDQWMADVETWNRIHRRLWNDGS